MDLCLFTRRIRDRSPDLEILQHIGEQVAQGTLLMQEQLISLLSGPIKLPLCIRVIGYLRRMDLFSGPDLKRVFLSQRDAHMTFLLDQVRAQDPLEYLKKHIEVSRESLFDILTQYSAIFTESFSASSGNSGSTITVEPACSSQAILSFYTTSVIQDLLDVLQDKLTLFTDAAAISTILTQVLYYGLSLGRMGFDFRHWMVEVFEEAMLRLVASGLNSGTEAFIEGLRSIPDGPWESGAASSTHALSDLLSIPLLAALFNTYMAALNQLRILPILSTRSSVLSTVRSQLRDALEAVSRLGGERMDDWPEERLIAFERLNLVLSDVFLPQISSGLEAVYGRPLEEPLSPILPDSLLFKWASNARRRSTIVSNTHAM